MNCIALPPEVFVRREVMWKDIGVLDTEVSNLRESEPEHAPCASVFTILMAMLGDTS